MIWKREIGTQVLRAVLDILFTKSKKLVILTDKMNMIFLDFFSNSNSVYCKMVWEICVVLLILELRQCRKDTILFRKKSNFEIATLFYSRLPRLLSFSFGKIFSLYPPHLAWKNYHLWHLWVMKFSWFHKRMFIWWRKIMIK